MHGFDILMVCSVGACDIQAECEGKELKTVLHHQRECAKFNPWKPGFSPKEHKEMIAAERLEEIAEERRKSDRAWQEEIREKDRLWHLQQALDDKKRAADRDARDKVEQRRDRFVTVFTSILTGVATGAILYWLGIKR